MRKGKIKKGLGPLIILKLTKARWTPFPIHATSMGLKIWPTIAECLFDGSRINVKTIQNFPLTNYLGVIIQRKIR